MVNFVHLGIGMRILRKYKKENGTSLNELHPIFSRFDRGGLRMFRDSVRGARP